MALTTRVLGTFVVFVVAPLCAQNPPAAITTPRPIPLLEEPSTRVASPDVMFADGKLRIVAQSVTLVEVLNAVKTKTGASVTTPPDVAANKVTIKVGPTPALDVIVDVLEAANCDYIIFGSGQNLAELRVVARTRVAPDVLLAFQNKAVASQKAAEQKQTTEQRVTETVDDPVEDVTVESPAAETGTAPADAPSGVKTKAVTAPERRLPSAGAQDGTSDSQTANQDRVEPKAGATPAQKGSATPAAENGNSNAGTADTQSANAAAETAVAPGSEGNTQPGNVPPDGTAKPNDATPSASAPATDQQQGTTQNPK